jgi:hypothetical protein
MDNLAARISEAEREVGDFFFYIKKNFSLFNLGI